MGLLCDIFVLKLCLFYNNRQDMIHLAQFGIQMTFPGICIL